MKKPKIIVILGATSTGKSDLAVEVAHAVHGSIISADSRQVYKGMDLGSGKITKEEMDGVPHYLLDVANPIDQFTAHDFKVLGEEAIIDIQKSHRNIIVCGGTGFYIDSLIYPQGLAGVAKNQSLRDELEILSLAELQTKLDNISTKKERTRIDTKNKVRVIRAIEIISELGYLPKPKKQKPYRTLFIGLDMPKEELYEKVYTRLTRRMNNGIIAEVKNLLSSGVTHERLESFGLEYRHASRYIRGVYTSENEMIDALYIDIKKFIKRQYTWFKRNKEIIWLHPQKDKEQIMNTCKKFLN